MTDEATAISLLRELSRACANGSPERIEEAVNKAVSWYRDLPPDCKKCGRQRVTEDLEEWDDSLELLCFGAEDPMCVAPTKGSR